MTKFKVGDLVKHKNNDLYGIVVVFKNRIDILMIAIQQLSNHNSGNMYNAPSLMEEFWTVL